MGNWCFKINFIHILLNVLNLDLSQFQRNEIVRAFNFLQHHRLWNIEAFAECIGARLVIRQIKDHENFFNINQITLAFKSDKGNIDNTLFANYNLFAFLCKRNSYVFYWIKDSTNVGMRAFPSHGALTTFIFEENGLRYPDNWFDDLWVFKFDESGMEKVDESLKSNLTSFISKQNTTIPPYSAITGSSLTFSTKLEVARPPSNQVLTSPERNSTFVDRIYDTTYQPS